MYGIKPFSIDTHNKNVNMWMSVDQGHATNVVAHVAIRRLFRSGHVTRYAATTWLRRFPCGEKVSVNSVFIDV